MSLFWEIVVSNALLVVVLAVGLALLGRVWKHPAALHFLWVLVLVKLFVPPVYTIGLPYLDAPVPAQVAVSGSVEEELPWSVSYGPVGESTTAAPSTLPETASRGWRLPSGLAILASIWAIGVLLLSIGSLRRAWAFRRVLEAAEPASEEIRQTAERLRRQLGLKRLPEILTVPVRLSPMVWSGLGRPRIVLPSELMGQLDRDGRETILAHELAHVRRRDHLVRLVEVVAGTFFWWHPVVWWAGRELRELEEQCCDGMVLDALPSAGKSYATSLVETLHFLSGATSVEPLAATGAKPGSSLVRRITMLKNERRVPVRLKARHVLLLLMIAAVPMAVAIAADGEKGKKKASGKKPVTAAPAEKIVAGESVKPSPKATYKAAPSRPARRDHWSPIRSGGCQSLPCIKCILQSTPGRGSG